MKVIVAFVFVTTLVGLVKCNCTGAGTCTANITVVDSPNNATCGDTTCGSTCDYWCNEGYARNDEDGDMTRNEDGSYTAECIYDAAHTETYWDANCVAVTCDNSKLNTPDESTTNCSGSGSTNYAETCEIVCNEGYILTSGSSVVTCGYGTGTSGNWSEVDAVCEAIECDEVSDPSNGDSTCNGSSTLYNDTCVITCNSGYVLTSGSSVVICNEGSGTNGVWNDTTAHKCEVVTCSNSELNITGGSTTNCTNSGSTNYGETCEIVCNEGYVLTPASSVVTCGYGTGTSGNWSEVDGVCEAIECDQISDPSNGDSTCDGNSTLYNDTCVITCNSGYVLTSGSSVVICNEESGTNGVWNDTTAHKCEAVTCCNSELNISGGSTANCTISGSTNYGETCEIVCNEGYVLTSGSSVVTCGYGIGTSGNWSEATCEAITCSKLSITNGASECIDTIYNAKCQYTCDNGYGNDNASYEDGKYSATCKDNPNGGTTGVWEDAECLVITCPTSNVGNGEADCKDSQYDDTCNFTCNSGFGNSNGYSATCTSDGSGKTSGVWDNLKCSAYNVLKADKLTTIGVVGETNTIIVYVNCDEDEFGDACNGTTITVKPPNGSKQSVQSWPYRSEITYTLTNIQSGDGGKYTFESVGTYSSDTTTVEVTIEAKPSNVRFNNETVTTLTYERGTDGSILCTADGIPPPTITWYDASEREVPTSDANVTQTGGTLLLSNAYFDDEGDYSCTASNTVGDKDEAAESNQTISIYIHGSPVALSTPLTMQLKDDIQITCTFDASPEPNTTWHEDEAELSDGSELVTLLAISNTNESYTFSQTATLKSRLCKGNETITCGANNKYGGDEVSYFINQDTYTYFDEFYYSMYGESKLPYEEATNYCKNSQGVVALINSDGIQDTVCNLITGTGETFFIVTDEGDYTNWDDDWGNGNCVVIQSSSECKWKRVDCTQSHATLCQIAASGRIPTLDLVPTTCDGSQLVISWDASLEFNDYKYRVKVANNLTDEYTIESTQTSLSLTNTTANSEYTISVSSGVGFCKDYFPARSSSTVTGYTTPDRVDDASMDTSCTVSWKYTSAYSWQLENFTLEYVEDIKTTSDDDYPRLKVSKEIPADDRSYTIETNPNSVYIATIKAVSCAGESETLEVAGNCETNYETPTTVEVPQSSIENQNETDADFGIPITILAADERNGPISCYFVVVIQNNVTSTVPSVVQVSDSESFNKLKFEGDEVDDGDQYLSAAISRDIVKSSYSFTIGSTNDDETVQCQTSKRRKRSISDLTKRADNRKLISGKVYQYYLVTATVDGETVLYKSGDVSVSHIIIGGGGCNAGCIVGIILAAIIAVLICLGILYYLRIKRIPAKEQIHKPQEISNTNDQTYENVVFQMENLAIKKENLENEYKTKHRDEDRIFREEYQKIKTDAKGLDVNFSVAKSISVRNFKLNRFVNILPADDFRVKLHRTGEPHTDYINASKMMGPGTNSQYVKNFIASQGPLPHTVADFWRMIWEKNVSKIVMLTNVDENGTRKCEKYWPDMEDSQEHDDLIISTVQESTLGPIMLRRLELRSTKPKHAPRTVHQYHYTTWPDHGVPLTTSALLQLRKMVLNDYDVKHPIVVHCSAGVGRTGTFIALDILMQQMDREGKVDVRGTVMMLRKRRTEMVQSMAQYVFLHKLLLEHYLFGDTDYEAEDMRGKIESVISGSFDLRKEFDLLKRVLPMSTSKAVALKPENNEFNRDSTTVSYDHSKIILRMRPTETVPPYINASDIKSYRSPALKMIVTQDPLTETIEMFWRMVLDLEIKCIVMLSDEDDVHNQIPCATYWPEDGSLSNFGSISLNLEDKSEGRNMIERTIHVKEVILQARRLTTVQQIVLKTWPKYGERTSILRNLLARVESELVKDDSGSATILVHNGDGGSRVGCFCACVSLLERLKTESKVDVFRTVKDLRDMRPNLVPDLDEYRLCHTSVSEFLEEFDTYSNFQ